MSRSARRNAIKRARYWKRRPGFDVVFYALSDGYGGIVVGWRRQQRGEVVPEWMPIVLKDGTVIQ